ncbi:hypothetical protein PISMIDRAFT_678361 [Pisolithus microcarpus 441]|uniref:Uncharacterized protein n=1 Tax=Pisolithus microcarpus 441 TaxID=765257 RepID=A0A0C9Z597_9AGAM|nr:hypothetical protein PISMIDRAFT_678361 [Pisolithus microcarpus 441]
MSMKGGVTVVGYLPRVLLLLCKKGRKGIRSRGLGYDRFHLIDVVQHNGVGCRRVANLPLPILAQS